jgi:hypothetical protein
MIQEIKRFPNGDTLIRHGDKEFVRPISKDISISKILMSSKFSNPQTKIEGCRKFIFLQTLVLMHQHCDVDVSVFAPLIFSPESITVMKRRKNEWVKGKQKNRDSSA